MFCTGGAGTICSAQVRALVALGANACIVGRNVEKTETMAKNIEETAKQETKRKDVKVLGMGAVDVRSFESLEKAVARCIKELGGIDVVMYVHFYFVSLACWNTELLFFVIATPISSSGILSILLLCADQNRAGAAGNFLAPIDQLSPNAFKSVIVGGPSLSLSSVFLQLATTN